MLPVANRGTTLCSGSEEWLECLESFCNFNQNGFDNLWAVNYAHALKVTICSSVFKHTIEHNILGMIFLEAIKMTVPVAHEPGEEGHVLVKKCLPTLSVKTARQDLAK